VADPHEANKISTTSFERPVAWSWFLIVAKLSDEGTSTGDGMLFAEMGETTVIGAGVAAVGDPPASE